MRLMRARRGQTGPPIPKVDRAILDQNAKSMFAAMVGWTICSFFASVAFNWTFYYVFALAVAGREILTSRLPARASETAADAAPRFGRTFGARGYSRAKRAHA
jgi:hypothetical protein